MGILSDIGINVAANSIAALLPTVADLGSSFVKMGLDAENDRVRFEGLLGSTNKAKAMFADITKFANTTPFQNEGLRQNAESMLTLGVSAGRVMPDLQMMGEISGGNQEKLNSLSSAFGNISSSGQLAGADLDKMISAGFNPLKVISENTGLSMDKLKTKMQEGAISAKMIEDTFKLATGTGGEFNGLLEKTSQTTGVKLSNAIEKIKSGLSGFSETFILPIVDRAVTLFNIIVNKFEGIGEVLSPFFDTLKPLWDAVTGIIGALFGLGDVTGSISDRMDFFRNILSFIEPVLTLISRAFTWLLETITPLFSFIRNFILVLGGLAIAFSIVNFVMSMNPVGLIIWGIAILIGLIVIAWNKFATFRAVILGAWEAIRGFGAAIGHYIINRIRELLAGITGIGQALLAFFRGDFRQAWEIGRRAAGNLLGIGSTTQLIHDTRRAGQQAGQTYNNEISEAERKAAAKKGKKGVNQPTKPDPNAFSSLLGNNPTLLGNNSILKNNQNVNPPLKKNVGGKTEAAVQSITDGGSKQNTITINLAKMQDQIVINTISAGEGVLKLRSMIEEELMRLIGSITQTQIS